MTLTEFLLARIAEDDGELANLRYADGEHWWLPDVAQPTRLRNECEARRQLVNAHAVEADDEDWASNDLPDCPDCWQHPPCQTLRLLALPYASHRDYHEAWRPRMT